MNQGILTKLFSVLNKLFCLHSQVAAVDTSVNFSVSVSMNNGLVQVGNGSMVVYARAPNVTEVKFSNTGAKILVHFDSETEVASGDACSDFFSSETTAKLGISPGCAFVTTQDVEITPGRGAIISVGDDLVFKDNVFKAFGEPFSKFFNGSFPVSSPDNPIKPVPVITGTCIKR